MSAKKKKKSGCIWIRRQTWLSRKLKVTSFTDAELRNYDKFWDTIRTEKTMLGWQIWRGYGKRHESESPSNCKNMLAKGMDENTIIGMTDLTKKKSDNWNHWYDTGQGEKSMHTKIERIGVIILLRHALFQNQIKFNISYIRIHISSRSSLKVEQQKSPTPCWVLLPSQAQEYLHQ